MLKFTELPPVASISIINADVSNADLIEFLNSSLPMNLHEFELSFYDAYQENNWYVAPSQYILSSKVAEVIEKVCEKLDSQFTLSNLNTNESKLKIIEKCRHIKRLNLINSTSDNWHNDLNQSLVYQYESINITSYGNVIGNYYLNSDSVICNSAQFPKLEILELNKHACTNKKGALQI